MDTSLEYINQCEKAEEVQNFWHTDKSLMSRKFPHRGRYGFFPNRSYTLYLDHFYKGYWGSFVAVRGKGQTSIMTVSIDYEKKYTKKDIWLPRQDQLQEMIEAKVNGISKLAGWEIVGFFKFVFPLGHKIGEAYILPFSSMEQLWLAFCMSEKFNKVWDGENWIVRQ